MKRQIHIPVNKKIHFSVRFILLTTIVSFLSCQNHEENKTQDKRPMILKNLDGNWQVTGQVMGDSVKYKLYVRPVLNNTFSELHMVDVSIPPQYEALVFIGYDTVNKKIISHWLDSFGPAYSIPHGSGTIEENKIEFIVPYQEEPFRDMLTYNEKENTWAFLIESSVDSKIWNTFAEYIFTR